jgi:hypothetical protein
MAHYCYENKVLIFNAFHLYVKGKKDLHKKDINMNTVLCT